MSTTAGTHFAQLLSSHAAIGSKAGGPLLASSATRYEFGSGKPDPGSFPYDGIVEATARMMKIEGDQALTYGEPLGYRGLRELLAHKYDHLENLRVSPESFLLTNGSSHALSLAISMFVDIGDPVITEPRPSRGRWWACAATALTCTACRWTTGESSSRPCARSWSC